MITVYWTDEKNEERFKIFYNKEKVLKFIQKYKGSHKMKDIYFICDNIKDSEYLNNNL